MSSVFTCEECDQTYPIAELGTSDEEGDICRYCLGEMSLEESETLLSHMDDIEGESPDPYDDPSMDNLDDRIISIMSQVEGN